MSKVTVMLIIDVSGSRMFGSQSSLKKNILNEIAAVLAFSAVQNSDKVGCILFSDQSNYITRKETAYNDDHTRVGWVHSQLRAY